jgi:hypothetical protein
MAQYFVAATDSPAKARRRRRDAQLAASGNDEQPPEGHVTTHRPTLMEAMVAVQRLRSSRAAAAELEALGLPLAPPKPVLGLRESDAETSSEGDASRASDGGVSGSTSPPSFESAIAAAAADPSKTVQAALDSMPNEFFRLRNQGAVMTAVEERAAAAREEAAAALERVAGQAPQRVAAQVSLSNRLLAGAAWLPRADSLTAPLYGNPVLTAPGPAPAAKTDPPSWAITKRQKALMVEASLDCRYSCQAITLTIIFLQLRAIYHEEMARQGLTPDIVTLNTVMSAVCSMGWAKMVTELLEKEFPQWGVTPDARTYRHILRMHARGRHPVELEAAFAAMQAAGIAPDRDCWQWRLWGLTAAWRLKDALAVVGDMKARGMQPHDRFAKLLRARMREAELGHPDVPPHPQAWSFTPPMLAKRLVNSNPKRKMAQHVRDWTQPK